MTACPSRSRSVHANRFQLRAFVSLLLIASGVLVVGSGVILLVAPTGRMAFATGWSVLGVGRQGWTALHDVFGLLWIPLLVTHAVLNRKPILCYLKDRVRRTFALRWEALAAVVLTVLLATLTVSPISPVSELLAIGHGGSGGQVVERSVGATSSAPVPRVGGGRGLASGAGD